MRSPSDCVLPPIHGRAFPRDSSHVNVSNSCAFYVFNYLVLADWHQKVDNAHSRVVHLLRSQTQRSQSSLKNRFHLRSRDFLPLLTSCGTIGPLVMSRWYAFRARNKLSVSHTSTTRSNWRTNCDLNFLGWTWNHERTGRFFSHWRSWLWTEAVNLS